jgi:predicted DNA-binding transcriptional regulator AlpA
MSSANPTPAYVPKRFHIDKRADAIAAADAGDDDQLLSTQAVASWLGISLQWLEIGRHRGYGPKFQKISARHIRYRRGDVVEWLRSRTFASTSEYANRRHAEPPHQAVEA